MSMTQKFEETSSVLYNIKGVVGQKRKVKADKTVRLCSKQFEEEHGSLFLVFSRLARQLGIGMEQHKIFRHDLKNYPYKIHVLQTLSGHKKIIQ